MVAHQPTHQRKTDFIRLETWRCEACWECIEVCPNQVLAKIEVLWHHHATIHNAQACNGCKKCVRVCESGALVYVYSPKPPGTMKTGERLTTENERSAYNKLT